MADIIKQPTWIAYTPTVTAGSGTFTSVSATGRYYKTGRVCHIQIHITITTNGTAGGWAAATLPFTSAAFQYIIPGRSATTGNMLAALVSASTAAALVLKYDNSYPGADATQLVICGTYETAS